MVKSVSPVISPLASTTDNVFSQVKTATFNRLNHTVSGHNRIPNLIAASSATRPRASASNPLPAGISDYSAQPGGQPWKQMHLDVQNTPPQKNDKIIDAIQRYLDIRPRREATADPLDEASIARHPQQLTQAAGRWDDARYYQFAANGLERYQFQPEFRAWGGRLELSINSPGQTGIAAQATTSPLPGQGVKTLEAGPDLVFAAQKTAGELNELAEKEPWPNLTTGPLPLTQNPDFAPHQAAQKAVGRLREALENGGPPAIMLDPYLNPASAWQDAAAQTEEALEPENLPEIRVGVPNLIYDELARPNLALHTATNVTEGLRARVEGEQRLTYRPRSLDEAYHRAFRIMDELEIGRFKSGAVKNSLA